MLVFNNVLTTNTIVLITNNFIGIEVDLNSPPEKQIEEMIEVSNKLIEKEKPFFDLEKMFKETEQDELAKRTLSTKSKQMIADVFKSFNIKNYAEIVKDRDNLKETVDKELFIEHLNRILEICDEVEKTKKKQKSAFFELERLCKISTCKKYIKYCNAYVNIVKAFKNQMDFDEFEEISQSFSVLRLYHLTLSNKDHKNLISYL